MSISPLHAENLSNLSLHMLCACCCKHCEFIVYLPYCVQKILFSLVVYYLQLLHTFYSLSWNDPGVFRAGGVVHMPHLGISILQSVILCILPIWGLYVNYHVHKKKVFLMRVDKCTNQPLQQKVVRSWFNIMSYSQSNDCSSPQGPLTCLQRFLAPISVQDMSFIFVEQSLNPIRK